MVESVRDIITAAARKLGIVRSGGTVSANDAADGLRSLTSLYNGWVNGGAFGRVYSVPISTSGDYTAGPNQHINVLTDEAVTIDLPAVMDTINWCNWRPGRDYGWGLNVPYADGVNVPPDKTVVRITDQFGPSRAIYIYDGYVQLWMRIDALGLNDEAPLSQRDADGLAAILAVRMSDEFGSELLTAGTVQAANKYKMALVTGYGSQERDAW
jgi:hypothetical protein